MERDDLSVQVSTREAGGRPTSQPDRELALIILEERIADAEARLNRLVALASALVAKPQRLP